MAVSSPNIKALFDAPSKLGHNSNGGVHESIPEQQDSFYSPPSSETTGTLPPRLTPLRQKVRVILLVIYWRFRMFTVTNLSSFLLNDSLTPVSPQSATLPQWLIPGWLRHHPYIIPPTLSTTSTPPTLSTTSVRVQINEDLILS
jgi:hypothetical protein